MYGIVRARVKIGAIVKSAKVRGNRVRFGVKAGDTVRTMVRSGFGVRTRVRGQWLGLEIGLGLGSG